MKGEQGHWVESGYFRFYITPSKLIVVSGMNCNLISEVEYYWKARKTSLIKKIEAGHITSWDKLFHEFNTYNEMGEVKAVCLKLINYEQSWIDL